MQISVAMATFNGGRYLGQQLDSLAAQDLPPAELVVSDDGSDDDTLAMAAAFSQRAPFPVRILERDRRRGFADNFLRAAGACRYPLIAFCDQDDVWLPQKLEVACGRMERDGSLLAMHRLTTTNEALEPMGLWTQGIEGDAVFEPLSLDPYMNGWGNTMLFRRELVTEISADPRPRQPESPERPLSHDSWIYVLAAALGRVSHIAAPLVLYRQHGGNAMGVGQNSSGHKGKARISLSTFRLRQRMIFYDRMAEIFDDIAHRPASPYAEPADRAAIRYAERRDPIVARLNIYDGASVFARLRAFRAMKPSPATRLRSRAKDLVLGVAGLHALLG